MISRLIGTVAAIALMAVSVAAQEPPAKPPAPPRPALAIAATQKPPAPAPAPPTAATQKPAPAPGGPSPTPAQLVNIRIEVAVVEEGGGQPAVRKVASLTLADRQNGSVRSTGVHTPQAGEQPQPVQRMMVDAYPMMQRDGRVQLQLTLEYGRPGATTVRVEPLLESGKTLVVSEAGDLYSDRKTRVELTATILK